MVYYFVVSVCRNVIGEDSFGGSPQCFVESDFLSSCDISDCTSSHFEGVCWTSHPLLQWYHTNIHC